MPAEWTTTLLDQRRPPRRGHGVADDETEDRSESGGNPWSNPRLTMAINLLFVIAPLGSMLKDTPIGPISEFVQSSKPQVIYLDRSA